MKQIIMVVLVLISGFALSGCTKHIPPTNEEIITETKKCKEAGMEVSQNWDNSITCVNEIYKDSNKLCEEKGGIPIRNKWDGSLKECIFTNSQKE